MSLSDDIHGYISQTQEPLPTQATVLLQRAAELLDTYRFVSERLVLPDPEVMEHIEIWAPNHYQNIVGDKRL